MKVLRLGGIVAIMCFLYLFGMVHSTHADEITSMSIENGASGCYVSLTADEDIMWIDWYVKQTYPKDEADDDYELVHTSMHGAGIRSVYENITYLEGHIKIARYKVKATVHFAESNFDTAVDTVSVEGPVRVSGIKPDTGAYGYTVISSFYYNGSHMIMSSCAYARNPINNPKAKNPDKNPMLVEPWFRTNQFTEDGDEIHPENRDTKTPVTIQVGETSQPVSPGPWTNDGREFDRHVGTLKKGDEPLYFLAHTHFRVSVGNEVDDWEADTGILDFTWEDK